MRTLPLLLCVALAGSGCRSGREDDNAAPLPRRVDERGRVALGKAEREALGLEVASAAQGTLTTSSLRYGKVLARPQEDALVAAPVTGRLVAPTLALGAKVAAGDVLLALEPLVDTASRATLEAQRRELQGQIDGARAQVEAKKADLARLAALVSSGLATEAERAQAQAELASEQARADSLARAAAELGRVTGGRMELRAPAPGVVAALATDTGTLIQQGTVLARIVQPGRRWIDVAVPPADPVGSAYRVAGLQGPIPAKLLNRGAVIQPDGTRRDRLEAEPDAAASLPPGATVAVEVLHDAAGVLVPAPAVLRQGRDRIVFVEVEEGRYQPRTVEVTARDEARAVVASGLAPGDRVVTRGAASLFGELFE